MTTDSARRDRLRSAAGWGLFVVVWIVATALLPLPGWLALAGGTLPDLPTLGLLVWLAATLGYVGRAVWQRFETEAPDPDNLEEVEDTGGTDVE